MEQTTAQTPAPAIRPRRLSKKQRGFVRDYVATGNGTESARRNYDVANDPTASAIAVENLEKPIIVEAIALEEKKLADRIPNDLLVERHIELLNKREVHRVGGADGQTEYELIDQPDTQAVSKGLEMAYKLKGAFAAEVLPPQIGTKTTYNFIFSAETQADVKELEDKIKARLIEPNDIQTA